jgi:carboxymethylenebutenolidase
MARARRSTSCIGKARCHQAVFAPRWHRIRDAARALISQDYRAVAPVTVFLASDDEEVSPAACHRVLDPATNRGDPIRVVDYAGATHDFDDPGEARQSVEANRTAREDVLRRAAGLFAQ